VARATPPPYATLCFLNPSDKSKLIKGDISVIPFHSILTTRRTSKKQREGAINSNEVERDQEERQNHRFIFPSLLAMNLL
jgi:hypothetical protein